uniref:Uncharacterized protein LOC111124051 n=1 Tax=Crassostrea virginica TaxID=6565 RepID=A0A8B8D4K9_CRAVI|nr:uncharacterized protein LOC111124051 [Crassostrea virginica]
MRMKLYIFLLIVIPALSEGTCSFPFSSGSWTDSKYGTILFSGGIMYMSQKGFGTGATNTNWTCDAASGSRYLARTVNTVALTYGSLGTLQLYLYMCMDITMVTQYSYYYYQQTEDSVDLGRMKGSQTANYQMSDVCTTTIAAELFQILVKQDTDLARYLEPLAASHVQLVFVAPVPNPFCDIYIMPPENRIVPYLLSVQLPEENGKEQVPSVEEKFENCE